MSLMTLRAITIGVVVTLLVNVWIRYTELPTGRYVSLGVPPPPAVIALLALAALAGWRVGRRGGRPSRGLVLMVYAFLTITIPLSTFGLMRAFFPCLTAPFYFATDENRFNDFNELIPEWLAPRDREVIRQCYEGAEGGAIPWSAWRKPLLIWTGLFALFFAALMCMASLFRRQWVEHDRLTFPLLYLPLEMTEGLNGGAGRRALGFFRNPVMWAGFSLAAVINLMSMLHAVNPSVPALGQYFNLGAIFTERPLDALRPLYVFYLIELVGFGYLVPLDMLFSIWFFYFVNKFIGVGGRIVGYEPPGFPYYHSQSAGAYWALALALLWMARRPLLRALRGLREPDEESEALSARWAAWGLTACLVAILAFARAAGMAASFGVIFFGSVFAFALVVARLRGEAGLPVTWPFPYDQQKEMWLDIFGSDRLVRWGGQRSMVMLSTFSFLSRHYYPTIVAYQLDNLRLCDSAGVSRRRIAQVMWVAFAVGVACAIYIHLSAYYDLGANILEGNPLRADYRTRVALSEYARMFASFRTPRPVHPEKSAFILIGFTVAMALTGLRRTFLRLPFHPLGYAISTAYQAHCPYWAPCLLVWLLKLTVLKLGGARLYRKLIPGFLGLALGHYFMGGMVWPVISMFLDPAVSRNYHLAFGG